MDTFYRYLTLPGRLETLSPPLTFLRVLRLEVLQFNFLLVGFGFLRRFILGMPPLYNRIVPHRSDFSRNFGVQHIVE